MFDAYEGPYKNRQKYKGVCEKERDKCNHNHSVFPVNILEPEHMTVFAGICLILSSLITVWSLIGW